MPATKTGGFMMKLLRKPIRDLILIWLAWSILVIGFQAIAVVRFQIISADTVLEWTWNETLPGAHNSQPYLRYSFMNQQVAYDSEFYLSIAVVGYDDPAVRAVWLDPGKEPRPVWEDDPMPFGIPRDLASGRPPGVPKDTVAYSLNYAFFPFYPLVIRLFSLPLLVFGLKPIATATLGGVIVSLLGALGGMLALYDLTRDRLEDSGAIRAAFYLIAFPTGFFLAMVHTEGLFVGLAFGSLAMLNRKRWVWAGLLAGLATLTRAVGVALIIPLGIAWLEEAAPVIKSLLRRGKRQETSAPGFRWDLLWKGLLGLSPLIAFGLWNLLLGHQFRMVEAAFFSRGLLTIGRSLEAWSDIYHSLFGPKRLDTANWIGLGMLALTVALVVKVLIQSWHGDKIPALASRVTNFILFMFAAALVYFWLTTVRNEQRTLYYLVEFSATILGVVACAYTLRSMPGLSLFGLMVIGISFFSGVPQGMHRYVLGVPAVFVMLGYLGHNNDVFDRIWTVGSVLLMGLFALLFAFNYWVG
jgi:hypothetical protein